MIKHYCDICKLESPVLYKTVRTVTISTISIPRKPRIKYEEEACFRCSNEINNRTLEVIKELKEVFNSDKV